MKNAKLLPEFEDEEIKNTENFEELLDLKTFVEEYQKDNKNARTIFKLNNINVVRASINQQFDPYLAQAQLFEFFVTENIIEGFNIKDTLLELVPDYISLGYNKDNTSMKDKGYPIWLYFNLPSITMKTLSIFWTIKNKNVYKLKLSNRINRDKSQCTKAEWNLLKIIKNIHTLKEIYFVTKEGDNTDNLAAL